MHGTSGTHNASTTLPSLQQPRLFVRIVVAFGLIPWETLLPVAIRKEVLPKRRLSIEESRGGWSTPLILVVVQRIIVVIVAAPTVDVVVARVAIQVLCLRVHHPIFFSFSVLTTPTSFSPHCSDRSIH